MSKETQGGGDDNGNNSGDDNGNNNGTKANFKLQSFDVMFKRTNKAEEEIQNIDTYKIDEIIVQVKKKLEIVSFKQSHITS